MKDLPTDAPGLQEQHLMSLQILANGHTHANWHWGCISEVFFANISHLLFVPISISISTDGWRCCERWMQVIHEGKGKNDNDGKLWTWMPRRQCWNLGLCYPWDLPIIMSISTRMSTRIGTTIITTTCIMVGSQQCYRGARGSGLRKACG